MEKQEPESGDEALKETKDRKKSGKKKLSASSPEGRDVEQKEKKERETKRPEQPGAKEVPEKKAPKKSPQPEGKPAKDWQQGEEAKSGPATPTPTIANTAEKYEKKAKQQQEGKLSKESQPGENTKPGSAPKTAAVAVEVVKEKHRKPKQPESKVPKDPQPGGSAKPNSPTSAPEEGEGCVKPRKPSTENKPVKVVAETKPGVPMPKATVAESGKPPVGHVIPPDKDTRKKAVYGDIKNVDKVHGTRKKSQEKKEERRGKDKGSKKSKDGRKMPPFAVGVPYDPDKKIKRNDVEDPEPRTVDVWRMKQLQQLLNPPKPLFIPDTEGAGISFIEDLGDPADASGHNLISDMGFPRYTPQPSREGSSVPRPPIPEEEDRGLGKEPEPNEGKSPADTTTDTATGKKQTSDEIEKPPSPPDEQCIFGTSLFRSDGGVRRWLDLVAAAKPGSPGHVNILTPAPQTKAMDESSDEKQGTEPALAANTGETQGEQKPRFRLIRRRSL